MKKVGTITSSAGLIFLGVWMIINKSNPQLGREIFKFWPAIFILLGAEILILHSRKKEEEKIQLNYIIIPIIIVFLITNAYQGFIYRFSGNLKYFGKDFNFDNFIKFTEKMDSDNYKVISSNKVLLGGKNKIYFSAENVKVIINKSADKNIKIDAKIYVYENQPLGNYNIETEETEDGYKVYINEPYIRKVEANIYVPDKMNIDIEATNSDIKTVGDEMLSIGNVNIKCANINGSIENAQSLIIDSQNLNFTVYDTRSTKIEGNNCNINVKGNCEDIDIEAQNGRVNINNNVCKKVSVDMQNGMLDLKTKDKNINIAADLQQGTCRVNDEKRVNSGIVKSIGQGIGKVDIKLDRGTINISALE
ncbi:hypothetical protein SAMN05443428_109107 [Caloramator quimbayensis]|uniref:DUF5668 domain-containing protein n=1 Tax=Caloramator quimbayensis TaxID=1147123 RepID=A0A1T4XIQ9_9CLOT|nr:DUF4097 family beta strand repeat-containing protein [Caloramator quimbayensis]SKA89303.1 hypothetical protein SAMN05443428_109107 [Caloramator quimbayensis]